MSQWLDARTHAPPEGMKVLIVGYDGDELEFATYLGENGQTYRRLPNAECWGHWYRHQHHTEGPEQIRWWMHLPTPPRAGE